MYTSLDSRNKINPMWLNPPTDPGAGVIGVVNPFPKALRVFIDLQNGKEDRLSPPSPQLNIIQLVRNKKKNVIIYHYLL